MSRRTTLNADHRAAGARMVDFGGWDMPLHYGSQIEEHHAVRRAAGVFDVSHMRVADFSGSDAAAGALLGRLLAADIGRCSPGHALYSCMLDERGGVVDDLIVYRPARGPEAAAADGLPPYRAVLNAGTADDDLARMRGIVGAMPAGSEPPVAIVSRDDLSILALQGPQSMPVLERADPALAAAAAPLAPFACTRAGECFIGRTGYTGEDGFEIMLPSSGVRDLWQRLLQSGAAPCGLAARDTLRLEAGMCLHGQDLDTTATPFESALAWTVDLESGRPFIGREALVAQRAAGVPRALLGLVLLDKGVLRSHMPVATAHGEGVTTSGTFSPTLQQSIALARLPSAVVPGDRVEVQLRGRSAPARVVRPRFVRRGQSLV